MREIEQTTAFKKDLRREGKGQNLTILNAVLPDVLTALENDVQLAAKYQDHKLTGDWTGCRDCHLKPDLIMIYEVSNNILILHRLGSHSELFG